MMYGKTGTLIDATRRTKQSVFVDLEKEHRKRLDIFGCHADYEEWVTARVVEVYASPHCAPPTQDAFGHTVHASMDSCAISLFMS